MAIITGLPESIKALRGKLSKDGHHYFTTRNGKVYLYHRNRRQTKYSDGEIVRFNIFAEVSKQTTALLKDPETRRGFEVMWKQTGKRKHCTLRGFVFSMLYKQTVEELNNAKNVEK